jgi:PTS system fructose-specific IIA component
MDWQSLDGNPIDLIFMIGVPEASAGDIHLKILANLSRRLMKEDFRNSLRAAKTPAEVLKVLQDYDIGL